MLQTLIVDNGAGMLKAGLLPPKLDATAASLDAVPVRLPNCTAKSRAEKKFFVADGLDTAVELSALYIRRPHERGFVMNWDLQGDVWQRMCHADVLGIKPSDTSVLVTEPLFCPNEIKDNMDEFIFEEMGFQASPRTHHPNTLVNLLPIPFDCNSTHSIFLLYEEKVADAAAGCSDSAARPRRCWPMPITNAGIQTASCHGLAVASLLTRALALPTRYPFMRAE